LHGRITEQVSGIDTVSDVAQAGLHECSCGMPAAHTYANMQINEITGHYAKNSTVSKGKQEAYHHKVCWWLPGNE